MFLYEDWFRDIGGLEGVGLGGWIVEIILWADRIFLGSSLFQLEWLIHDYNVLN